MTKVGASPTDDSEAFGQYDACVAETIVDRMNAAPGAAVANEAAASDAAELLERHPELRPRLIPTRSIHEHNRSRRIDAPGAYEWWEIQAFDEAGNGLICALHHGNGFDPAYRHAVRRLREGRVVESSRVKQTGYPAVRVAVFQGGRLAARAYAAYAPGTFVEASRQEPWSIAIEGTELRAVHHLLEDGRSAGADGWSLSVDVPATTRGWKGVLRPGTEPGGRIRAQLRVKPTFHTTTIARSSLPDSPSGAAHDWLIACPSSKVDGGIFWTRAGQPASEVRLAGALGAVEHFWGEGPVGEGTRRRYGARLSWPEGAAFGELIVVRKYIQIAGTLTHFVPGGAPRLARCDRAPRVDFQRSAWLLGYPLELTWSSRAHGLNLTQRVERLNDASPFDATCLASAVFEAWRPSVGEDARRLTNRLSVVRIWQPARADSRLWSRWSQPQRRLGD